ncbi:RMD1 family protein [Nodosilinea sp. LEGE 07298]|uniref:RMD1 family protein n=1 Tax=Nodosilinea sp. LEGE 07298 TaxID=2777970 RepID=UPI00187FA88E|nr:RMD1 family protein [Nodosilinea sp. LEGE 07298]MBE9109634.1 RMD1 family protein [Nodosilinea sp. LEGE 07298]
MTSTDNSLTKTTDSQTLIPTAHLDWASKETILARASIVGERLSLKTLDRTALLATNPLIIRAGATGCAVLLRYGVIITFDLSADEENALLDMLRPHIVEPIESTLSEELSIAFRPQAKERLEGNVLWLQDYSAERLQIVAEALGKSVVLNYYEVEIADIFQSIKPFTIGTQGKNRRSPKEEDLLNYIGGTLLIQQKMFGIVEVGEKPDPVWDDPTLDRLYLRLEDEYELRERLVILEKKLELISRTVETSLNLLQRNSSHRVEWYITILIVIEIALVIYELWTR